MSGNIYTDGTYAALHPGWHTADAAWKAAQVLKIIHRNHLQPASICDVGCGSGEVLSLLYHKQRIPCTGYEISPQAYVLCQARQQAQLTFYRQDFLNIESAVFDLVLALDVLEHVEDYYTFLRKLKEKGKYKILHIPLDLSVMSMIRKSYLEKKRREVGHIHYFTRETALAALKDTGYRVIDWFYTAVTVDLPAQSHLSAVMRIPRKVWFALAPHQAVRVLGGYALLVLAC